jgi:hypothetical protein
MEVTQVLTTHSALRTPTEHTLEGWPERTEANYIVQKWQVTVGAWPVANTYERQRPRDIRGMRSIDDASV